MSLIEDAIKSNWIAPVGPFIDIFERKVAKYLKVNYASALSSGTAALHLALKVLGVKSGDIVFCSDLTFVACANSIRYLNAKPVFIDSDLYSWNMCSNSLEKAFQKYSPKAVIVTNIYGQSANYSELKEFAKIIIPLLLKILPRVLAQNTKNKKVDLLEIYRFYHSMAIKL